MKPPPVLTAPAPGEPLAWVVRGQLVESVHTGHLAACDADGALVLSRGEPEQEIYPRSSVKPLQALAMLRVGVRLDDEQLALACASHNGEPRHLEVVRSTLASAHLSEADLENTADLPLNPAAAAAGRAAGRGPSALTQNCSGKHSAMLATCRAAGWPTARYRDPAHPLQHAIADTLADLTGVRPRHVGVDGCGAALFSTTVLGLARGFARLATAPADTPEGRIARVMSANPWLVGGTGRDVTAAMESVPGLIAKDGAEGIYAAALPDGRAVAFKISDGAGRPRPVVLAAALHRLGVEGFWPWAQVQVLGHGEPAGAVRPAFGADAPVGLR